MSAVPVIYSTSSLPAAAAIRRVTWGDWSHVAGIDERRVEVVEAVWPRVRIAALDDWLAAHPRHDVSWLPARDPAAVVAAWRSQDGKPYDLLGALGLGLHRDWQDPVSWWCSELIAWGFDVGGSPLFRADALHRVTPQHLRMLAPAQAPPLIDLTFFTSLEGRRERPSAF